jgi:DNA (cytosine-5)-methyltransferase 1
MVDGTRSNLWVSMREAIAILHPSVVIWENVRGALSAYAYSEMESEPGLLGESYGPDRPALRAAGRVVGDLSDLGYDTQWITLPASDVGAPHKRERVFVLAHAQDFRHERRWPTRDRGTGSEDRHSGHDGRLVLLPTPDASNANDGEGTETWLARRERVKLTANNGNGMGMPLAIAVQLLPTPQVADATGGHATRSGDRSGELLLPGVAVASTTGWAEYEPAVRLWESLTRPAPSPTLPDGKNGNHRLAAVFPEWMMGYPAGWVTDVIPRNPAIKACGNGVVPQQAFAALSILWARALEAVTTNV